MEEIRQQVDRAYRRMVLQQFLTVFVWVLFTALCIAAIALALPKFIYLNQDYGTWTWQWLGGSILASLVISAVWTYVRRRPMLDAAIAIDKRFGLRERISSSLAMAPDELDSEVGKALVNDTIQRVKRIDVRDEFSVGLERRSAWILLPATGVLMALLLGNVVTKEANASNDTIVSELMKKELEKRGEKIKKIVERQKKKEAARGLEQSDLEYKKLISEMNKLQSDDDLDQKKTLMKLNDLAKSLSKRRDAPGGVNNLRKQMEKMDNIAKGPADKLAKAVQDGNFQQAMKELQKLQEKMKDGGLNEEEKKQLEKQLGDMQQKMQQMVDRQQQAKQDLEKQIQQLKKQGNLDQAGKLQQKLDQMNMQKEQMDKMQQMAEKLGQCKQCMQKGDMQQAAQQMQQMADQLQELQDQLDELEMMDEMMDELADAKKACAQCQGQGMGQGQGQKQGRGMGPGQGQGERPEEETDAGFYKTRVRMDPKKGEAVMTGIAHGPNRAGKSLEGVKDLVSGNLKSEQDPISEQRLPKSQFEHAKEYFEAASQ